MPLPEGFQFSQSSLQDYVECARRFQLRYLDRLAWPAVEAEPILEHEVHMAQGERFHHLVHQHLSGISVERLQANAAEEPLSRWWSNYLKGGLNGLPEQRFPEITLSAEIAGYRLIAKYDVLAIEPGKRAVIVDWKTALRRPSRERLARRLQTIVYRYVLARAGRHINGGEELKPEQIRMIYWFADFPTKPEMFDYDGQLFQADEHLLTSLIKEIEVRDEPIWMLTPEVDRCHFCRYRSLCERGQKAGDFTLIDLDNEVDALRFDFDFDQIIEIEF